MKKWHLVLLCAAGLLLILSSFRFGDTDSEDSAVSTKIENTANKTVTRSENRETAEYYEEKLEAILKNMEGVGRVEVMVTIKSSGETTVLKDTNSSTSSTVEEDTEGGKRSINQEEKEETTVSVSASGTNNPFIIKETEAEILGVLILAEGCGTGTVMSDIVSAVEVLFDIGAHKVKVLPMKHE